MYYNSTLHFYHLGNYVSLSILISSFQKQLNDNRMSIINQEAILDLGQVGGGGDMSWGSVVRQYAGDGGARCNGSNGSHRCLKTHPYM